ncbi:hypothetical protein GKZ28_11895 [Clostridium chromiireducens]|uniref:Uncharacterized protein n=1 Tax=Clostridium chromiireducens TaxID=225345 RepID=A0A964RMC6_9CLOT|nr:DUF5677 domain-containing protein [Clostridium chromiireducens]MVX64393.1 hypothetical protein [Clostridium chromiireducens]
MRNAKEDIESGKFSKRDKIADLQVYQLDGITYCLPINSSPKLRQYFATAILAYKNDAEFEEILLSQDIEEYEDEKWIDGDLTVCFMLARGCDVLLNIIVDFYNSLVKNAEKLSVGEIAYFNALTRLRESFKSVLILCDRGFFVEMMPIMRLIYEQLCWACYSIDETDIKKLNNNWKTKNTKYLKEKINSEYGQLYSLLSNEAHMAPPEMGKYLEIDEEGMVASVRGRSAKKAREDIPYIIMLYHIFLQVFEYGVKHFPKCEQNYYQELINEQILLVQMMKDIHNGKEINFSFIERV